MCVLGVRGGNQPYLPRERKELNQSFFHFFFSDCMGYGYGSYWVFWEFAKAGLEKLNGE